MLLEALALVVCISVAICILFTPVRHLHSPSCIFSFWLAKLRWKTKTSALSLLPSSMLHSVLAYSVMAGSSRSQKTQNAEAHLKLRAGGPGGRPTGGNKKRAKSMKASDASAAARKGVASDPRQCPPLNPNLDPIASLNAAFPQLLQKTQHRRLLLLGKRFGSATAVF